VCLRQIDVKLSCAACRKEVECFRSGGHVEAGQRREICSRWRRVETMTGRSDEEERRLEKAEDGDGSGKGEEKDRKKYSVLACRGWSLGRMKLLSSQCASIGDGPGATV
jgi:hypothetical protein